MEKKNDNEDANEEHEEERDGEGRMTTREARNMLRVTKGKSVTWKM